MTVGGGLTVALWPQHQPQATRDLCTEPIPASLTAICSGKTTRTVTVQTGPDAQTVYTQCYQAHENDLGPNSDMTASDLANYCRDQAYEITGSTGNWGTP